MQRVSITYLLLLVQSINVFNGWLYTACLFVCFCLSFAINILYQIAHARTSFQDHIPNEQSRHVLRLWLSMPADETHNDASSLTSAIESMALRFNSLYHSVEFAGGVIASRVVASYYAAGGVNV